MKRIGILVAMLLVICMVASAEFDKAVNISNTSNVPSRGPACAFSPDGIVHLVWTEQPTSLHSEVYYANYDGTTISTPIKLSSSTGQVCNFPFIAINRKGMMVVIWEQNNAHWLRTWDPILKEWQPLELVAGTDFGWLSKPKVTLDDDGNIFTFYFTRARGWAHSRAKINGVWEPQFRLNGLGVWAKEGMIAIAPNGTIWVVWGSKQMGGNYKVAYRKRTVSTQWSDPALIFSGGNSQEQPYVTVGADSIPWVSYIGNSGQEGSNAINLFKLNEKGNPSQNVAPNSAFHYPRIVMDADGFLHVASEWGQGDHGKGVWYYNNVSGDWKGPFIMPNSGGEPKLPGLAADAYGNIAVCYDSLTNGTKEAWLSTRYPVEPKHFYPPTNPTAAITVSGTLPLNPSVTYDLSWSKNPDNNDKYVGGYRIYKKVGDGDWQFVIEVSKDTLSYQFVYTTAEELSHKVQYAVSTISTGGFEGDKATF